MVNFFVKQVNQYNSLETNCLTVLQVVATDLESGDIVYASLQVDVLQKGQPGTSIFAWIENIHILLEYIQQHV